MTTAQAEGIVNHPLEATAAWLSDVAGDPVAFVEGAFPWGDGELANFDGPRAHFAGTHEQTWRIDLQPWNPNRPEASPAQCRSARSRDLRRGEHDRLGSSPRNRLKVPMMLGCSQMRTFSVCNNCRSRASRPGTNHSWG